MQYQSFFSHLSAWRLRSPARLKASPKLFRNPIPPKTRRTGILFLTGLVFFCTTSIMLLGRHQLVRAATDINDREGVEVVTESGSSDRVARHPIIAQLSANSTPKTVNIPEATNSIYGLDNRKPKKKLNATDFVFEEQNEINSDTSLKSAPDSKLLQLQPEGAFDEVRGKAASSYVTDEAEQSLSLLEENAALELPPLANPEQYLPEAFEGYIWPAQGTFTSGYGWRWGRFHQGIDIAAPIGTPVMAAATGTVVTAKWSSGGYGNLIELEHPDGSITVYAHNNRILVSVGQSVEQNQQIAEMGNTGYSTGSHLHFEIHLNGDSTVDPMAFLNEK